MAHRPLIGVVPLWDDTLNSLWMLPGYFDGIIEAGGIPVMLPLTDDETTIEQLVNQCDGFLVTGGRGFHFTDEAAPPGLLRALSQRLIARKVKIEWWCNIRFEKGFAPELARLMARAGCIAVTGGLETVCDRTLRLMQKGVTVEEAARAARNFAEAGILVHAYLMYGFPTQTAEEILDALERVRRLFANGWIQSAYWHRFALTAHSPMAREPKRYGIRLLPMPKARFARNEIRYKETRRGPQGRGYNFGPGLRKAIYNYMHGAGLDRNVTDWFDFKVRRARSRGGAAAGSAGR